MTKIHWHILERSYSDKLSVVNNFDGRCYECYDLADAAWLAGLLNKLEISNRPIKWKVGDWVVCIEGGEWTTEGKPYKIVHKLDIFGDIGIIDDEGDRDFIPPRHFKYIGSL